LTRFHTVDANALLMPSSEGEEIEVALDKGFRAENLHVVDRNPAIVANLKRRYPTINTYGVTVERAGERIRDLKVQLSVANLDLCGTFDSSATTISAFLKSGCMAPRSRIAVTGLRGREAKNGITGMVLANDIKRLDPPKEGFYGPQLPQNPTFKDAGELLSALGGPKDTVTRFIPSLATRWNPTLGDVGRLMSLLEATLNDTRFIPDVVRIDKYKSNAGSQTMLWCALDLMSYEWVWQTLNEMRLTYARYWRCPIQGTWEKLTNMASAMCLHDDLERFCTDLQKDRCMDWWRKRLDQ
jgi:hypothetical protein